MLAAERGDGRRPATRERDVEPAVETDASGHRGSLLVMVLLTIPLLGYAALPDGDPRQVLYAVAGLLCVSAAFWGLLRPGPQRRPGWLLVTGGFACWVLGDWIYLVEHSVFDVTAYPAVSDAVYISSYAVLAAGLVVIVRRRGARGDLSALLDAAILAAGTAVVAGVFLVAPVAGDSTLSFLGKLTSSLYPVGDVLLLGILARLWTTPGARTAAFKLLAAGFALTLCADALSDYLVLKGGAATAYLVNDELWLGAYVLVAGAAWSPSVRRVAGPHPGREDLSDPTKRMAVLTAGLLLPAFALLGDTLDGGATSGVLIAVGSILLSILVLGRMAGLLSVVSAQAVQLAALARSDSLTGLPNRRTLDHELSRACQTAREHGTSLTVAIIDLDRFKQYNDTFGHPAGDLLLREASAAWVDILNDRRGSGEVRRRGVRRPLPGPDRHPGPRPRPRPAPGHSRWADVLGGRRHLGPRHRPERGALRCRHRDVQRQEPGPQPGVPGDRGPQPRARRCSRRSSSSRSSSSPPARRSPWRR